MRVEQKPIESVTAGAGVDLIVPRDAIDGAQGAVRAFPTALAALLAAGAVGTGDTGTGEDGEPETAAAGTGPRGSAADPAVQVVLVAGDLTPPNPQGEEGASSSAGNVNPQRLLPERVAGDGGGADTSGAREGGGRLTLPPGLAPPQAGGRGKDAAAAQVPPRLEPVPLVEDPTNGTEKLPRADGTPRGDQPPGVEMRLRAGVPPASEAFPREWAAPRAEAAPGGSPGGDEKIELTVRERAMRPPPAAGDTRAAGGALPAARSAVADATIGGRVPAATDATIAGKVPAPRDVKADPANAARVGADARSASAAGGRDGGAGANGPMVQESSHAPPAEGVGELRGEVGGDGLEREKTGGAGARGNEEGVGDRSRRAAAAGTNRAPAAARGAAHGLADGVAGDGARRDGVEEAVRTQRGLPPSDPVAAARVGGPRAGGAVQEDGAAAVMPGRSPSETGPPPTPRNVAGGQGLDAAAARIEAHLQPHLERSDAPGIETSASRLATRLERLPWAERLADALRVTAIRGGTEMRLALEPEGLGHIDVRLTLHHDGLRAAIVAEHDTTRSLLAAQQHLLHAALERSALRLAGFSVDLGFAGGGTEDFGDPRPGEGQGSSEAPLPAASTVLEVHSVPAAPEPGRLSVRV